MSCVALRRAGREPSCSREISSTGVAAWKNACEARVAVDQRRGTPRAERRAISAMTALAAREPLGSGRGRARASTPAPRSPVSSSSRWAISGSGELRRQHLALLGHLHPARDRARAAGRGWPRLAGPPPRPSAPPRPWKNTQRTPYSLELLGERDLRAVGRPARRDVPRVLVGVRVADHHLLLVADRAQRGAVDGQLAAASRIVSAASDRVSLGLEQRHDPQQRALAAGRASPLSFISSSTSSRSRRVLGARDHVRLHRAGVAAVAAASRACGTSRRPPASRRRSAPRSDGDQRPALGDLAREQRAALGRPQRRVRLVHAERRRGPRRSRRRGGRRARGRRAARSGSRTPRPGGSCRAAASPATNCRARVAQQPLRRAAGRRSSSAGRAVAAAGSPRASRARARATSEKQRR